MHLHANRTDWVDKKQKHQQQAETNKFIIIFFLFVVSVRIYIYKYGIGVTISQNPKQKKNVTPANSSIQIFSVRVLSFHRRFSLFMIFCESCRA